MADASPTLTGKKVLIVEDDQLLHKLLADQLAALTAKGISVFPVMNAEEGLAKARDVKPDLVMLDLVLPGMSGFEFLEALRREPELAGTKVVILSNLSDDSDKVRAKDLGAVAFFVKINFSLDEVAGAIEELLLGRTPGSHESEPLQVEKRSSGYLVML